MAISDESLNPAAKLLLQKYVFSLLGGFGALSLAVLGPDCQCRVLGNPGHSK